MWIDAIGSEDEIGPVEAVGAGGEECAAGIGGIGTRSEVGAIYIVM